VSNGETVRYCIEDGTSNFELGSGVFTASGTTLTRVVSESSNSNNAINLTGSAIVFITAIAADLQPTTFTTTVFTATANQTAFTVSYTVGFAEVFLNGSKLSAADFTATNGTSIVLASGATVGDTVDVVAYATQTIANVYTQSQSDARYLQLTGGTLSGDLTGTTGSFSGDVTIADKIVHSGDTNTAIRFPAVDTFTVETDGSERMRVNASGVNIGDITINGSTISDAADFTIDVGGDIILDADDGIVNFKDGGTAYGLVAKSGNNLIIKSEISDGDLVIRGNDGGSEVDALTLDMSEAGAATFNSSVNANKLQVGGTDVITNARALSNITSIDATTAAAIGAGGVGGGGTVDFTASGSLSNGNLVKLNSNGTVSVVAGGGAGSEVTFDSTNCSENTATFDSNSNKVVVAYKDGGNSNYGTAVVGTVSGSSISFGSPVVFESDSVDQLAATFDSNSNKVVIVYKDTGNNYYGTAVVGTVSGTSISFGTPVVFHNQNNYLQKNGVVFDSNSNKVVIFFGDLTTGGKYLRGIVGTVSGTSISFGSPVQITGFNASNQFGATFDSNSNKVVVAYRGEASPDYYGHAKVGTVSGTSISFGSEATFRSGRIVNPRCTFDSNSNKVVVAFVDYNNGERGAAAVGTVSGTSISFGTSVFFTAVGEALDGTYTIPTFDSDSNKVIIAYENNSTNPDETKVVVGIVDGTSIVFQPSIVLDSDGSQQIGITFDSNANRAVVVWTKRSGGNYGTAATFKPSDVFEWIGFASADVSNGATATINVVSSVNEGQSSLEVGSKYYLLDNGTISTTVISGREVGFATAATKLLITQGSVS
jgi:hypothetical protein